MHRKGGSYEVVEGKRKPISAARRDEIIFGKKPSTDEKSVGKKSRKTDRGED